MIAKEYEGKVGLPSTTMSICPECKKKIEAKLFEENGKVIMEKECPEHGKIRDVVSTDVELYLKMERLAWDGIGIENPYYTDATSCPDACGMCNLHKSHACITILDLTNRCNLRCPICFANANEAGYVYEPTFEQVVEMMENLRAMRPFPAAAIQFSGGEPTIYPRFLDVLRKAGELGFTQIQIATNGITLAEDPNFAQECADAGLHTIYLQFDGMREEDYKIARGKPLLDIKKKAIGNVRKVQPSPMSIVLVPTLINSINDDQVGPIMKFAVENRDVIRGVNYQPVAFTGRISKEEREKQRFTLADLAIKMEEQFPAVKKSDWYPVPVVVPISEFIANLSEEPKIAFTSHPQCGLATYLFIDEDGNSTPMPRFIDVEPLMKDMWGLAKKTGEARIKLPSKVKAAYLLKKYFHKEKAPKGMNIANFLRSLEDVVSDTEKKSIAKVSWDLMFVGSMHFQDGYNYDINRVMRCAVHYPTPDGRIIPFCAYNGGPIYRTEVEKKFSVPLDEWRKTNKG